MRRDCSTIHRQLALAHLRQHRPQAIHDILPPMAVNQNRHRRFAENAVDRRQGKAGIGGGRFRHHVTEIRI
jgi:hypothetical protein